MGLFLFQGGLGRFDVPLQRLGCTHQIQNPVFGLANLFLAVLDLVLKRSVPVVGFASSIWSLSLEIFCCCSWIRLQALTVLLIGGQGGAVTSSLRW